MLVTLPNPISELQDAPLPLKVLRVRERALTPYFSVVFSLDSHLNQLRSLGGASLGRRRFRRPQARSLLRVGWYTWVSEIRAAFSTLRVIMASITLFFMKPFFSFPMCAYSGVQWLLLITTLTN
jgi:hypothetical protein